MVKTNVGAIIYQEQMVGFYVKEDDLHGEKWKGGGQQELAGGKDIGMAPCRQLLSTRGEGGEGVEEITPTPQFFFHQKIMVEDQE